MTWLIDTHVSSEKPGAQREKVTHLTYQLERSEPEDMLLLPESAVHV